ncbi:twin-arginine translocase TatA/TatE family subunit [Afifella pfennigii]|uniref:twin-arginine translocase TatA/TatE family subunit n=1 Tax=Afifella pfennigii TaxID=209897 RepID=UPI00047A0251|nr:twin-arginine translocase TatA/TatE family subunit [Afifella pfennigii]
MSIGFWQIAIIAIIIVLLFGRGKISDLMGDVAKGIKSFKSGLAEDDTQNEPKQSKTIEHNETPTVEPAEKKSNVS